LERLLLKKRFKIMDQGSTIAIRSHKGISSRRYHPAPPLYRGPIFRAAPEVPPGAPTAFGAGLASAAAPIFFQNRAEAGRRLAATLQAFRGAEETVVLGLPRGGVAVASEVAQALSLPLDIFTVRTLRPAGQTAVVGAVAEDGDMVIDDALIEQMRIPHARLIEEIRRARTEVKMRAALYREGEPPMSLEGKTVIVVDDGVASGGSMRMALQAVARNRPARCIVAAPIAPPVQLQELAGSADELSILLTPSGFQSIANYYLHFPEVADRDVVQTLRRHAVMGGGEV
jgi:predicted phosphoribosyltransferase